VPGRRGGRAGNSGRWKELIWAHPRYRIRYRDVGRLILQWSLVFRIGAKNRSNGTPVNSFRRIVSLVRAHLATRVAYEISD
jgi:hypothetical protein